MSKTADEKKQHQQKIAAIIDELSAEYGAWFGWTVPIGKSLALGEYILDETSSSDLIHDEWLMVAREAYLKWKKVHNHTTTPPPNRKAE